MENKPVILLRATLCAPADEEKFNRWYNEIHVPLLLKYPGLTGVSRYRMIDDETGYPKYLAVYNFTSAEAFHAYGGSPEKAAADKDRAETWKDRVYETTFRAAYELLRTWRK